MNEIEELELYEAIELAEESGDEVLALELYERLEAFKSASRKPAGGGRIAVTGLKKEPSDPSEGPGEMSLKGLPMPAWAMGAAPKAIPQTIETPQGVNRVLSGAGKAMTDVGLGATQRATELATGLDSPEALDLEAQVKEKRRLDAPLMNTAGGQTGNFLGYGVMGGAAPATVPGSILAGSLLGATMPTTGEESPLVNTVAGATLAGGGHASARSLGRMLSPQTSPQARLLMDEGVPLTPGQVMGGFAKAVEDKITSIPITGDMINSARRQGITGFNRAALNRIVRPLGQQVGNVGHEGVEQAYNIVTGAYNRVLPNVTLRVDRRLGRELAGLQRLADRLPDDHRDQFLRVMQDEVLDAFTASPQGPSMAGQAFKRADSVLGQQVRRYSSSLLPSDRDYGDALRALQRSLRDTLRRTNPQQAPALRAADRAYSRLLRVERAASQLGAHESVFTPAQLRNAIKAMDPSIRKRQFAHGRLDMQDFAEAGQAVLPSTYPDSGSVGRGLLGGGLLAGAGYGDAAIGLPVLTGALLGGAGAYTQPMQALARGLLSARPQVMRSAGDAIGRLTPYAAGSASGGFLSQ